MNQTLAKIKRLEKLVQEFPINDTVLDLTLDKILEREINKLEMKIADFSNQIRQWEETYQINSTSFIEKFESGQMGDNMDFVEWASTLEMKAKSEKYVSISNGI